MKKRCLLTVFASVSLAIWLACAVLATAEYENTALHSQGFSSPALLCDRDRLSYTAAYEDATVTVSSPDGIDSLYVVFDKVPSSWTLFDGTSPIPCGENGFLHEYVNVTSLLGYTPTSVTMTFDKGTSIAEIYGFTEGSLPSFVQVWETPCTEADILLFSSHSDDEQLFFGGLLPLYAGEKNLAVQVVYLVNHNDTHNRPHELLDGLWTVGVRHYPIISHFPDLYSESLEGALQVYAGYGYTYDDFCKYMTEQIRRFRPQVVISHDVNGEYGHGTHILCTAALKDSLLYAADSTVYTESAQQYGLWDTPKTYLHLYGENQIVINYDEPLASFGGKTAFQVTQDGFACHKSQHWTWFYRWIYGDNGQITKASQISTYSPCLYGLYRSTIGPDTVGGDFFENMTSYATIRAEEEARRLAEEAEKQRQEEERRRLAEEEAIREEESRKAAEESERLAEMESESKSQEEPRGKSGLTIILLLVILLVAIVSYVVIFTLSRPRSNQRKRRPRR